MNPFQANDNVRQPRSEPCNLPRCFNLHARSKNYYDRGIRDFSNSEEEEREGEEASFEFYIPFEKKEKKLDLVHTRISWQNRSVNGPENEAKRRGIIRARVGHKYRLGGARNAFFESVWECADYDIIGIIDGHDLPRLRRGSLHQRFAPTILIYG